MAIIDTNEVEKGFTATRPTTLDNQLAPDSDAKRCFVNQGFSRKLQVFMIDYSLSVGSPLSHTLGTK